eukprot:5327196-Prymnesium_polylepis.1
MPFDGGALDATSVGAVCPQNKEPAPEDEQITDTMSEDCLKLHVYTPPKPASELAVQPLPVVVWIHGGSFMVGTGNMYNGSNWLALNQDIIVVSINYRLGALGFLAEVDEATGTVGNFGLLDQRRAIDWVTEHIGAFGGDPARITLAGESAGAISIGLQLVTPFSFAG